MSTLTERISVFLLSVSGAESIDDIIPTSAHPGHRRADYLLDHRRVIVELKTLETDTAHKIATEMDKHHGREDFPVFYGTSTTDKILARLPEGDKINQRIFGAITRSVEDAVRSAEEQIEETRKLLGLPEAVGLLLLLNESIDVLSPEVVGHRVATLMRRERTGQSAAPAVHFAWLLLESHVTALTTKVDAFPSILIEGPGSDAFPWFEPLFATMQEQWANRNYAALAVSSSNRLDAMKFVSAEQAKSPPPSRIRRSELWAREYDAAPFLRALTDEQVLQHGAKVIAEATPYFLKGGPKATREDIERVMRALTCFFREASFRALDMRKVPRPPFANNLS